MGSREAEHELSRGVAGSVESDALSHQPRWRSLALRAPGLRLSAAFASGLVLSLVVLGTLAAAVGQLLTAWKFAFAIGTAMLSFAAGLALLMGPVLRRRVPNPGVRQRTGIVGAFVYGILYSVATITTSAGPLVLLLTVATAVGNPAYGALLSLGYALGRGIPFLLLGIFAGAAGRWLARIGKYIRPAEIVSGLALVGLAVYFVRFAVLIG